jgi:hypothetical protein
MFIGACAPDFEELECDWGALVSPESLSPGGSREGEIVGELTPTLSWTYPDTTCIPEYYRLTLATTWHDLDASPAEFRVPGWVTEWTPETALQPGTTYFWRVQAGSAWRSVGGRNGIFRTGPLCDTTSPATLLSPEPLWPENRSVIEGVNPTIEWDDPTGCIAEGHYVVEISESRSLATAYLGHYPFPYLFVARPWVDFELEECTQYYWRVYFDRERRFDADDGPYSDVWSFITGTTTGAVCPPDLVGPYLSIPEVSMPPDASGDISGYVWHDECMTPSWDGMTAPEGCVAVPFGGFEADGLYGAGEPGIEGVTVRLGLGLCPVEAGLEAITDASGYYSFDQLWPGTYCISIDALQDGNEQILIPGNWTFPERWYGPDPIELQVTFDETMILSDVNFGWDYRFLPSASIPVSTSAPVQACWHWNANLQKVVCTMPCPPNPQPGGACTP